MRSARTLVHEEDEPGVGQPCDLCADASLAATQALADYDDAADAYEEAAARAETAASACS